MVEQELQKQLDSLTPAECRVLYYLCHGYSNRQIARELGGREVKTVESHITVIYSKLQVKGESPRQRLDDLRRRYCPLLLAVVKDPAVDCERRRGAGLGPVSEREVKPRDQTKVESGGIRGNPDASGIHLCGR